MGFLWDKADCVLVAYSLWPLLIWFHGAGMYYMYMFHVVNWPLIDSAHLVMSD